MNRFVDARIPLVFADVAAAGPGDAVLREGAGAPTRGLDWFEVGPESTHPIGCACCAPRNSAGVALARLLLARGRGDGMFFSRVVVAAHSEAGRRAVLAALATDPLVSACFRSERPGLCPGPAGAGGPPPP
jgi:hypothetical protein